MVLDGISASSWEFRGGTGILDLHKWSRAKLGLSAVSATKFWEFCSKIRIWKQSEFGIRGGFFGGTDPSGNDSSRLEQEKYWSKCPNALGEQGYSKAGDSMGWFGGNLCFPAWNNGCRVVKKLPKKAENGERKVLPPNSQWERGLGCASGRKALDSGRGLDWELEWMGFFGWDFDPLVPPAAPGIPWISSWELHRWKEAGMGLKWVQGIIQGKVG